MAEWFSLGESTDEDEHDIPTRLLAVRGRRVTGELGPPADLAAASPAGARPWWLGRSRRVAALHSLHAAYRRAAIDTQDPIECGLEPLLEPLLRDDGRGGETSADRSVVSPRSVEASRLFALWCLLAPASSRRDAALDAAGSVLQRLGRALFDVVGDIRERPALPDHQVIQATSDLARATEALGPRTAHRVAAPLATGMLGARGLRSADRFVPPPGWRQLEKALITAIEEGAGSLLGVALLEAARGIRHPNAAHFRDVVGAATADGAQTVFRRFEEISSERRDLERRAGVGGFQLTEERRDLEAERALLQIEDDDGVVERYERLASRVRRTIDGLRVAAEDGPEFTLEFGQGRLLELATAVVG